MYIDNSEPTENVGQIHFSLEYDFQNTTLILKIMQVSTVVHVFILFSKSFYFFFITLTLYLKCQFVSRAFRFKKKMKNWMCENWWWIQAMPLLSPKSLLRRADCFVLLHIFRVDFSLFFSFLLYNVTARRKDEERSQEEEEEERFLDFELASSFPSFSLLSCVITRSLWLFYHLLAFPLFFSLFLF